MSDGIKRWHEEMDEYTRLCEKYNEQPVMMRGANGRLYPDGLSDHARGLKARECTERGDKL